MPWPRIALFSFSILPAACLTLPACGSRSGIVEEKDCLEKGSCECRDSQDCRPGHKCVNGFCRQAQDGGSVLGFGEACFSDDECLSGYCIPNADGDAKVCTRICAGECPTDWVCKVRVGDPNVSLCSQRVDRLCADCSVDGHCNPAFGDYCLDLGGLQSCGRDCSYESCPVGYTCKTVEVVAGSAKQCVPDVGTCACTTASVGLTRPCENENPFGVCSGEALCLPNGEWSECSALTPSLEVCNGIDDDCNGLVDAKDPGIDVTGLPSSPAYPACQKGAGGTCAGTWACQPVNGSFEWVCTANDPHDETCDGADNDCDGEIDETFVDARGRYVGIDNCGKCGLDCRTTISNAATDGSGKVLPGAVECRIIGDVPVCVPVLCSEGYYPYPPNQPIQCHPLASPQCRPCTTVTDCTVSQDKCVSVGHDHNKSCLKACGSDSPYPRCQGVLGTQDCCPEHFTCSLIEGAPVCVPEGDTCECDAEHKGVERSCIVTGQDGAKCEGMETCLASATGGYAWSACETVGTTDEVCDGADNDCDGEIDEAFIGQNGTGTYDTDEHCGACHNDCSAKWSPEIQHAIGGCVASSAAGPECRIVACANDVVGGGGACQLDRDCPNGWRCNPPYYHCSRECATASDCPTGSSCNAGWCTIGCRSSVDCVAKFGWLSSCLGGYCQAAYDFHNTDRADSNGCECPSAVQLGRDVPDTYPEYPEAGWPYVDRDCDGVDGEANTSLFVWDGTDMSLGTREHPYRTIGEAMAAFNPSRYDSILVATGQYEEAVVLRAGVGLFGGYSPDFSKRDVVGYPTLLIAPQSTSTNSSQATVWADGIKSDRTVVAGFAIYGADAPQQAASGQAGRSSYAVYLRNCSDRVVIVNNLIFGGRGGDGGHGQAGAPGYPGGAGSDGAAAKECVSASCAGERQSGGRAGTNGACPSGTVGSPGAGSNGSIDPQPYQPPLSKNGRGGVNATYSSGDNPQFFDLCKYDCQIAGDLNGQDASAGSNGQPGGGGSGCANEFGSIVNGLWSAGAARSGGSGTAGEGGGGGGAGGCVLNRNLASCSIGERRGDLGGTGGGGGAGGCGGGAGRAGGAGGGSFAVFVTFGSSPGNAIPRISGNVIYVGEGGAGGDGAFGGQGGPGGLGGAGGTAEPPAWCAGPGGKGGRGGDGGPGGGGGGGCGGVAFGVAGNFISPAQYDRINRFVQPAGSAGSPGGSGGPSPAGTSASGTAGLNGQSGVLHVF